MKNGIPTAALLCALAVASSACDRVLGGPRSWPLRRRSTRPPGRPRRPAAPPARSACRHLPRWARTRPSTSSGADSAGWWRRAGFYTENGAYTEDFDRLGFQPEGEASFRFLWLTRDGWAASGTHPAVPGRDCVIFVGRVNAAPTRHKYVRTAREG
jgi:hypothetical protein